ncbi:hypothetical protein R3P38DRAFT_3182646 [Favolaschia claudopus]|uniref:Secreted protein n=1 Tax=Favolaschia claudopus TaxID=2862362 RepID=A0AAW0CK24_9AGAR
MSPCPARLFIVVANISLAAAAAYSPLCHPPASFMPCHQVSNAWCHFFALGRRPLCFALYNASRQPLWTL